MGRVINIALVIAVVWASGCTAEVSRRHKPHKPDQGNCPSCDGPDEAPNPGDFAFYFLVRQWGPEFCHQGCTRQPDPDQFTLHGLWPNLDNPCTQDFPEHCQTVPFKLEQIPNDTYYRMESSWPSLRKANKCFWAHEWDCHGSCSKLDQQQYFKMVLDLHDQYNIKAALDAENIVPSNEPIRTDDVIDAISKHFDGVKPILHCSKGGGRTYLNEVWLPINKNFEAVDSSTVCREHPCVPSDSLDRNLFCEDELIYKLPYTVDLDDPQECVIRDELCEPKSGTCKPDKRGQQDMLFAADAS